MANLPVRQRQEVDRHSLGDGDPIDVLFVIIGDYGGHTAHQAAVDLWATASAEQPGAVIHVIHPSDPNLTYRGGRPFFRGIELESLRTLGRSTVRRRAVR